MCDAMFTGGCLDLPLAFLIGIGFPYFSVAPMRGPGSGAGIEDAHGLICDNFTTAGPVNCCRK
jgi:hypothetical protein